jgi:mediator of RNA polymerase II transcription subunit 25
MFEFADLFLVLNPVKTCHLSFHSQPSQMMGMSGPQQAQLMGNQQLPQHSGVSTLPGQQQMIMSAPQPNQPGTSADPSMISGMNVSAPMNMVGMQPQPTPQQMSQSRAEKNKQLEKIIMVLERSSPEQQQQLFQKMPQLTPEMQQTLLQRVHALRLQKQQLQRQQQQQQQLHAMNQQQQQQGGMMGGQMPDVMGQLGMSGGLGQQSQQQQQQSQSSQMARQQQTQAMSQGGMGMQMGMQRVSMQAQQQQQQQQQQQPPGMDRNTFQWQSQ